MSTSENKDSQAKQGFVLPKKKKKQISSSVFAGLLLLLIMVGALYWFQQQAQLKEEMDELIETGKSIGENSLNSNKQETEIKEVVTINDEAATSETEKQLAQEQAAPIVEEKTESVTEVPALASETAQVNEENVGTSAETTNENQEQAEPNVSLSASQPLFENILMDEEEPQEKKKIVVEFDVADANKAQVKELDLKEITSNLMAFESLTAVKNANALDVQFGLKNLGQQQHRGRISFALIQADGTRSEITNPQGTYSFRMRVDKKYPIPVTAENKEIFENPFALIVEIKDRNDNIILSKPYKF